MERPKPDTTFNWGVYANATFAGLSPLIPIPLLDGIAETFWQRGIPKSIARWRGKMLAKGVAGQLNRQDRGCLQACIGVPLYFTYQLLKDVVGKILYFIAIKEATDKLSYYWHYAFLVDYALASGHLAGQRSAWAAKRAMLHTLKGITTSPLNGLATQIVSTPGRVWRSLRRVRNEGVEDEVIEERRGIMARAWGGFTGYFETLADNYDREYWAVLDADKAQLQAREQRLAHIRATYASDDEDADETGE